MAVERSPTQGPGSASPTYPRFVALDGLRGLAALVVVVHHSLLVSPELAVPSLDPLAGATETWAWWLTYTPLHLLWAGPEAVFVFFVLSGFVLALPFSGEHRLPWRAYYPRRLARLYLPVWAAVALAVAVLALVPLRTSPDFSWWMNEHAKDIELVPVLHDLALLVDPGRYVTPLWSLRWEIVFSLLLPLYTWSARIAGRAWVAAIALCLVIIGSGVMVFLPMFAIGVLMAFHRQELVGVASRLRPLAWAITAVLSVLLLSGVWLLPAMPGVVALPVLGAAMVIFMFATQRTAIRIGTSRPVHWLGRISFSLYLVHEPVVVAVAFTLAPRNPWLVLAAALPISLAAATVFFRAVEQPSHRLANVLGRRFGARPERTIEATRAQDADAD